MIGRHLLIHSATVYTECAVNADRVKAYGGRTELKNVRVTTFTRASNGSNESGDALVLFYDCQSSEPKDIDFDIGMKVEFDGREFFVKSVSKCFGLDANASHYEITLG